MADESKAPFFASRERWPLADGIQETAGIQFSEIDPQDETLANTPRHQRTIGAELRSVPGNRIDACIGEKRSRMKEQLGRCAEHLRKAVRYLALSSCIPQEQLTSMYHSTGLGSIYKGDFPNGSLRRDFQAITGQMNDRSEPQFMVHIAAMSDERARKVIEQIRELSADVSCALGGQK
jgi:hypothetical protein